MTILTQFREQALGLGWPETPIDDTPGMGLCDLLDTLSDLVATAINLIAEGQETGQTMQEEVDQAQEIIVGAMDLLQGMNMRFNAYMESIGE